MVRAKQPARIWIKTDERIFVLEVCIVSGPMTEDFIKRNQVICRTIEIRGDQTLEDLHYAIFKAFDRDDHHMYEFQIGGKGPMDPKAKKYVLPVVMEDSFGDRKPAGTVSAAIGSLDLKTGDAFGYTFDYGDDWWHQVNVTAIKEKPGRGKYPKIKDRVGESPPQYVDWEELE